MRYECACCWLVVTFLSCSIAHARKPQGTLPPVEVVTDTGMNHCIGGKDSFRARMVEVGLDNWAAGPQSGTCEIGPLKVVGGSAVCASKQPVDVLVPLERIELVQKARDPTIFDVIVRKENGDIDFRFKSFSVQAEFNPSNGKVLWLRSSNAVPVVWNKIGFDVFIYFKDDSDSMAKAKIYDIEFFDRSKQDCINEEPSRPDMLWPTDENGQCEVFAESPVGEGRQPQRVAGQCVYQ